MASLDEQLNNLHDKLLNFAKQYQFLQKENDHLRKELEKSITLFNNANARIDILLREADAVKIGSLVLNESDKKELQKRIDGYLKEIEKCLQILNE